MLCGRDLSVNEWLSQDKLGFLASDQIQVEFFFFFHINIVDDILKDKNNSLMINVKWSITYV